MGVAVNITLSWQGSLCVKSVVELSRSTVMVFVPAVTGVVLKVAVAAGVFGIVVPVPLGVTMYCKGSATAVVVTWIVTGSQFGARAAAFAVKGASFNPKDCETVHPEI